MIDVRIEKPFSFASICELHPTHPSVQTQWRWALKGLRGIRLETAKIGGRRYTTFEAIDRFAARLTEPRPGDGPKASKRRQQEVTQAVEEAEAVFGVRPRPRTCPRRVK